MAIEVTEKVLLPEAEKRTVVDHPPVEERQAPFHPVILQLASLADDIPAWGTSPKSRDRALRDFWPSESFLASAVYGVTIRNASFAWEVIGSDPEKPKPKNTANAVTNVLNNSGLGEGWRQFITKTCIDLYTQDNGAYWEIIRPRNRPDAPVLNLNVLDSARCLRTGDPEWPVIYTDREGKEIPLRYWQVIPLSEFPSPIEEVHGMQVCAVSRALLAAQILRDIAVYKREKVSGRFTRAIHAISGLTKTNINDALAMAEEQNLNRGLYRYTQPVILPGVDPTSPLSHVQIDLATLPDAFDEESTFKWYIAQLALAFGVDYQEFAPLMSGNLGSSQQAEILHLKTRGKGPASIMSLIEHHLNSILPKNIKFRFKEQDLRSETEKAEARFTRSKDRSIRLKAGEIDGEAARLLAVEDGDLPEWLAKEITLRDKEREETERQQSVEAGSEFGPDQVTSGIDSHTQTKAYVTIGDVERVRKERFNALQFS